MEDELLFSVLRFYILFKLHSWLSDCIHARRKLLTYLSSTPFCIPLASTRARWAGGLLELGAHGEKGDSNTKTNFLCFFVASGAVEASIHKTTVKLSKGGMFFVPPGACCDAHGRHCPVLSCTALHCITRILLRSLHSHLVYAMVGLCNTVLYFRICHHDAVSDA